MCAAVPILMTSVPSDVAPTVAFLHPGYEQRHPASFAIFVTVADEKSSRFPLATGSYSGLVGP